jgi:hypothetical protein
VAFRPQPELLPHGAVHRAMKYEQRTDFCPLFCGPRGQESRAAVDAPFAPSQG